MSRADFVEEPARRTPVRHEADVLVVGGGAAGVAAAVAAARAGGDVLLVERSNALGGLATGGLIIRALYGSPYGSLVPRDLDNLLVAGRCISVDHRVHHATKEIRACFATGEAAGTAAALALATGVAPADLDVATLRARLLGAGAILTRPPSDLPG